MEWTEAANCQKHKENKKNTEAHIAKCTWNRQAKKEIHVKNILLGEKYFC